MVAELAANGRLSVFYLPPVAGFYLPPVAGFPALNHLPGSYLELGGRNLGGAPGVKGIPPPGGGDPPSGEPPGVKGIPPSGGPPSVTDSRWLAACCCCRNNSMIPATIESTVLSARITSRCICCCSSSIDLMATSSFCRFFGGIRTTRQRG